MQWEEEQSENFDPSRRTLLHVDVSTNEPLIVISTAIMLRWALLYGNKRPCSIDCTFGLTRYGYSVCTLTVLNGQGRGVPICVAIMKRERAEDFAAVIRILKAHLPEDWRPSIFLADDAKAEHNGIRCETCHMTMRLDFPAC